MYSYNQWQYMRDAGIRILANEISEICTLKNFTLSIGNSKYRYANKVQTNHSHNKTKSFVVLCCLHFQSLFTFSIFVHTFLLFRSHRGRCRDRISYRHWLQPRFSYSSIIFLFLKCFIMILRWISFSLEGFFSIVTGPLTPPPLLSDPANNKGKFLRLP